jgi:uroporphyrinogen decarboxylase
VWQWSSTVNRQPAARMTLPFTREFARRTLLSLGPGLHPQDSFTGEDPMPEMTNRERVFNTLHHKPVDRIATQVSPWGETVRRWIEQGHLKRGWDVARHFGNAIRSGAWFNMVADLDFKPVVIEETETTRLTLDGNGAKLRRHKLHETTPEHVDFTVKDRQTWERHAKPHLVKPERRRINFGSYRESKAYAQSLGEFFVWSGVPPFELMHPVCGHEHMLAGMIEDPDWVKDMVKTYADLLLALQEMLFYEEGWPDGFMYYEDLGFKGKPFMSPRMYQEVLQPDHKRLFDYAHSRGCKVIVHSCGYVEPLVPGLIEAGMDCLQAMEVKAGMDMPRMFQRYGERIAFFGNIDVRTLIANDRKLIDAELERKILPVVRGGGAYILHTDHSEPPEIEYDTEWYFVRKGIEVAARK